MKDTDEIWYEDTETDGGSGGANPRGETSKTPFQDALDRYPRLKVIMAYLPAGPTEESTEYDGLLSYSAEWHSAIFGVALGMTFATTGNMQMILGAVSLILGAGRLNQQAAETVKEDLRKEPQYGLAGIAIGFVVAKYAPQITTSLGL